MDLHAANDEIMAAHGDYINNLVAKLTVEHNRKTALESAKNAASMGTTDSGKSLSEAACDRMAKQDPTYLQLCTDEIAAARAFETSKMQLEYHQRKLEILLKG